ncbi:hypothetical protein GCM10009737_25310 [Nocardioides lentus]|uniref:SRPBCC family protein n=1 Tax=Nocardioides lentus TaxID=338077 RepID=A0ABP5AV65_9ACTN
MGFTVEVDVAAPPDVVHDYFADPALRPDWQSSLRRIDRLPGPSRGVGARWYDVTLPGAQPLMEVTVDESPHRWAERGTWRGVTAVLDMRFSPATTPRGPGTHVVAVVDTDTPGWRRPLGWGIRLLGPVGIKADLTAAARAIERRTRG